MWTLRRSEGAGNNEIKTEWKRAWKGNKKKKVKMLGGI